MIDHIFSHHLLTWRSLGANDGWTEKKDGWTNERTTEGQSDEWRIDRQTNVGWTDKRKMAGQIEEWRMNRQSNDRWTDRQMADGHEWRINRKTNDRWTDQHTEDGLRNEWRMDRQTNDGWKDKSASSEIKEVQGRILRVQFAIANRRAYWVVQKKVSG